MQTGMFSVLAMFGTRSDDVAVVGGGDVRAIRPSSASRYCWRRPGSRFPNRGEDQASSTGRQFGPPRGHRRFRRFLGIGIIEPLAELKGQVRERLPFTSHSLGPQDTRRGIESLPRWIKICWRGSPRCRPTSSKSRREVLQPTNDQGRRRRDRRAFKTPPPIQEAPIVRSELLPPRSRRLLPGSARGLRPEPTHRGPGEAAEDLQERPQGVSQEGIPGCGTNVRFRCRHRRQEHGPGRGFRRRREMGEAIPSL